ncbi:rhodanese-like protein [Thioalkalivibrio nitratireducens DSM 14787]|uniref:Rhodanese-like protein n=1 Tax=Thioalkalivibrio nitratireducens (strain DSM 14787 / UNIQEM 213 / ALEN2) TaxID=1255043 RepID=L0E0T6_THIND|nr:rhodanese-like domain-containing protein [Thioalkalivibrio nitratireducens]AGA34888.1 rhodanese-like protein [Thioalkalivibrio nitratireducens DSM 14787]
MFGISISEVTPQTLEEWDAEGRPYRLVDVRSMAETERGVLPGAELVPLHLIPLRKDELSGDRPVVLYCQTGARSGQACAFLAQQGITNVHNLVGGIAGWARSGKPIVAPD